MIILNDDVFEGKEKDIFSNVKEKTVSKYLYYNPNIEELFNLIFDSEEKYKDLEEHRELILKTIEETEELNARIYIQVLNNLLEWDKKREVNDSIVRALILTNICFINTHSSFIFILNNKGEEYLYLRQLLSTFSNQSTLLSLFNNFCIKKNRVNIDRVDEELISEQSKNDLFVQFVKDNKRYIKVLYLYLYQLEIIRGLNKEKFLEINNFIETGILIKDENK
ncbi:MAG: hypothetical protein HWD90_11690 [Campylobacteraceae bacterium]|nr:hypothetical protein [Campylobacteraceae bacterium]